MPQILINREPLRHMTFDVELLGDCDVIINELCLRLGDDWSAICTSTTPAREIRHDEISTNTPPPDSASTSHTPNSHSSNVVGASTVDNSVTRNADSTDAETPKAQADVAASTVNTGVCSAGASVSKDGSSCPSETGAAEATAAETSSSHPPSLAAGLQGTVLLHSTSVCSSALSYMWPTQEPNVVGADVIASPSL